MKALKYTYIPIEHALPGMIISEDIYTKNRQLLIVQKGLALTKHSIARLKFYSILKIPVYQSTTGYNIKNTPEFQRFHTTFRNSLKEIKRELNDIVFQNSSIDASLLLEQMGSILSTTRNSLHILELLHHVRQYDDMTYIHSINVALISYILGKWLSFPEEDLAILLLSGLLHDIGKLKTPLKILTKPSALTPNEYDQMKEHPANGYHILQKKDIDHRIKMTAFMHHERCDGSGYPNHLKSHQISDFAKIIAIADVYDAMTSNRIYRKAVCPFQAIKEYEDHAFGKYDPQYLLTFLSHIVESYLNHDVLLNTGQKGKIIMMQPQNLSKPVVQVGSDFIDLAQKKEIEIQELIC